MKLCWLVPDDRGGGVISVAVSCVRQARAAGHDAVLLLMLEPSGSLDGVDGLRTASLGLSAPAHDAPRAIIQWLAENPQDVLLLNGAEEADPVVPHLPADVRCVYVVHDTAARYWQAAVNSSVDLHSIVAVSQNVAEKFIHRLRNPGLVRVIPNGSAFPSMPSLQISRPDDIVFLGGSNPSKGAGDVIRIWPRLLEYGFTGRLHWFGRLEPGFEKQIAALPGTDRICRRGHARRDVIFEVAAESKVQLMLSRTEPFGLSTIECMSMGCVPVAWDIPTGTKEIVTGDIGAFVPLGNSKVLASEVIRLCAAHAQLAPLAARRAREYFSENVMWQGYSGLFDDLLPPRLHTRTAQSPQSFIPVRRRFQRLPPAIRGAARHLIGWSPRLGYLFRDLRGW